MKNRKGYMLIEIILASAIAFGIAYFILDLTIKLKNKDDDLIVQTLVTTDQTIITNKLMEYATNEGKDFTCNITNDNKVLYYTNKNGNKVNIDIVNDYTDIINTGGNKITCENKDGKITIKIPLEVKQMKDTDFNVYIDYKYEIAKTIFTITYDSNGGSGAPAAQSYEYATSGTINLSSTKPTRSGYTFLGWSLSNTATSASYSAGQAWQRSNANNYLLYAVWTANGSSGGGGGSISGGRSCHYTNVSGDYCGGQTYLTGCPNVLMEYCSATCYPENSANYSEDHLIRVYDKSYCQ